MAGGKTDGNGARKAVYIICSQDAYLADMECRRLLDCLVAPEHRAMAVWQPDAKQVAGAEVFDELRTLPLFAPVRVALIKDAEPFVRANQELLERYLDDPGASGVLILVVENWDKRLKVAKKAAGSDSTQVIEISGLKHYQLAQTACDYARSNCRISLDRDASELLVELVGDEPGMILRQVDSLALYVHPAKNIRIRDVERLVGQGRLFGAFEVIDALCEGRCGQAIDRLRRMFAQDRNSRYTAVGAFAYHFRRLFSAIALIEKGQSQQQAANTLGIRYYKEKFFRQAGLIGLRRAAGVLCELGRMDFGIKTGGMDAAVAVERLAVQLAEIFGKGAVGV